MDATSLVPGTTVGHYVIERLVAVGGSAAVYQARDPRARRMVAIKLLLADPESDPERGRRLLREARAYTRLVHPRIVTLFEVGEHEGRVYLAMEWVEGSTLADRLLGGALTEGDTVTIMRQVADGLSAAHAVGLAHRDLKPANIMITPDGNAKLLDFGLVKRVTMETNVTNTLVTIDGGIRGTPAYMSPEQVRGEDLSLSSDVFSFGVILYEVLGGKPAFARDTVLETFNAVTSGQTGGLPAPRSAVGRRLRALVHRCLELDPRLRPTDARELVVELGRLEGTRWPLQSASAGRQTAYMLSTALVTAALVALAFLVWPDSDRTAAPDAAMKGASVLPAEGQMPVITPDGSAMVYCSVDGREIWLSPLGTGIPELVWAGREPIKSITVTPNGRWVLFSASDGGGPSWVWEVSIDGGLPRKVTRGRSPAVSPDGHTVAVVEDMAGRHSQLITCHLDGTERQVLASFTDSMVVSGCCFKADGTGILAVMTDGLRWARLIEVGLDRSSPRTVVSLRGVASPGIAIAPRLGCALWCVRSAQGASALLCATTLASGQTRAVYPGPGLAKHPSLSADGTRLILQAEERSRELVEIAVNPSQSTPSSSFTVLPGTRGGTQPRLSPDGSLIAFQSAHGDLWVMERATGSVGPLLTTGEASFNPAWSADGRMVAYSCIKNGHSALWLAGADGSDPRRLNEVGFNCFQPVWHPSSRHLLFISDRDGTEDLYCLRIDSGEMARLNFDGAANPALAPDGSRVAFAVPRTEGPVLRMAALDPGASSLEVLWEKPVEVDRWAGAKARFSPDGRWIAYDGRTGAVGADIFALPVAEGPGEEPVRLTALPFPASLTGWFDWCGNNRLVVTVSRSSLRLLLVENADRWVSRAL